MQKESFNEKTVTQIGLVVDDIQKYVQSYAEVFGMERPEIHLTGPYHATQTEYLSKPTTAQARLAFFEFENITIELIEPVGGPSTWREFLDTRGPGIHHIAFNIGSMKKGTDLLEANNGKVVQKGKFAGGAYAYADMSDKLGMIVELLSFNI